MENMVYLGYYKKGSAKLSILTYILATLAIGMQMAAALIEGRSYAPIYTGLFAASVIAGICMGIYTWRSGIPRVILNESTLTVKLTPASLLRTVSSGEIDHIDFHPSRMELFLQDVTGKPVILAPQNYDENRRLKALLREFATANHILLNEAPYNPPLKPGATPH